jgi:hypothetical protein
MDIFITDVTEMHAGNYCVAGWDAAGGQMIGPLPGGFNWTEQIRLFLSPLASRLRLGAGFAFGSLAVSRPLPR